MTSSRGWARPWRASRAPAWPAPAAAAPDALLDAEEQAWVAKHPVLLFAPERDFPPFSFVDSQGQHRGLSADVLDLVQQHTGLKFQAVAAADRAGNIDRLKRREVDLLTSLRPTPDREQFIAFTSAYVSSPAVVLRRRGDHRSGRPGQDGRPARGGRPQFGGRGFPARPPIRTSCRWRSTSPRKACATSSPATSTPAPSTWPRPRSSSSATASAACAWPARPATSRR